MARFSRDFLEVHAADLRGFHRSWVSNPFGQWSRAWEYPFAWAQLEAFAAGRPLDVVDAGSGATFFPFFLAHQLGARVRCIDSDPRLGRPMSDIARKTALPVSFQDGDIRALDVGDDTVDAVVCISVLEHTDHFREITAEFVRILKPGGLLILTFDISPSGVAEVSPSIARDLIETVSRATNPFGDEPSDWLDRLLAEGLNDLPGRLTTNWARIHRPESLPWRWPALSALKASLPKGRLRTFIDLTCYAAARTKPARRG
jgi:SAM-dependent methyltransferase